MICIKQLSQKLLTLFTSHSFIFLVTEDRQLRKGVVQLRDAEEGQIWVEEVRYQGHRGGRTLDGQASLG